MFTCTHGVSWMVLGGPERDAVLLGLGGVFLREIDIFCFSYPAFFNPSPGWGMLEYSTGCRGDNTQALAPQD